MEPRNIIGLSAIAVGSTVQTFGLFLPPIWKIRLEPPGANGPGGELDDAVRAGAIFATAATITICLLIAHYSHSFIPLGAGIATAAGMVGMYEWALRG